MREVGGLASLRTPRGTVTTTQSHVYVVPSLVVTVQASCASAVIWATASQGKGVRGGPRWWFAAWPRWMSRPSVIGATTEAVHSVCERGGAGRGKAAAAVRLSSRSRQPSVGTLQGEGVWDKASGGGSRLGLMLGGDLRHQPGWLRAR